jgi:hypothetical protein
MSEKDDIRLVRMERLDNIYKVLTDLVRHEDERAADVLNISVLVQTILLAGLIQLNMQDQSLFSNNPALLLFKNILPLLGTLLSIYGFYGFYRRLETIGFWKEQIYRVEADSDFISEQYGRGLDVFTARRAYLENKRSRYPGIILSVLKYQRYFMELLFLLIWVLILGAQLYSYL